MQDSQDDVTQSRLVTFSMPLDRSLALAELAAQSGDLETATKLYRDILRAQPSCAQARHDLGLVLHRNGDLAGAIEQVKAAAAGDPTVALYFCNLCELYRQAGQTGDALSAGRQALTLNPDMAQALNNVGIVHFERGEFPDAIALYLRATEVAPGYAEAFSNLGNAYRATKRREEALAAYERALRLRPDFVDGLSNMGTTLRDLGRGAEAEAAYRRALAIAPDNPRVLNNLALALKERDAFEEAAEHLVRAVAIDPNNVQTLTYLALVRLEQQKVSEAQQAAARALELAPADAGALNAMGLVLNELGDSNGALNLFRRAIGVDPAFADPHNNVANVLKSLGQISDARAAYARAIELDRREIAYLLNLSDTKTFKPGDEHLAAMEERAADTAGMTESAQTRMHFALAKAYDDLGHVDDAFDRLRQGAALRRKALAYDEAATLGIFDRIRATFEPSVFSKETGGYDSPLPVFVVGMPRSGTTLVEQILASHPLVHGAGELTDFDLLTNQLPASSGGASFRYPEDAALLKAGQLSSLGQAYAERQRRRSDGAERVTDKMPANFLFLGLINLALPTARIVHVRRDPRDTCLSCFFKLFSGEQAFSYDLRELGRYYRKYVELMAHWRHVLPSETMLEVRYEDVVADLEGQARRIVEHCRLPWDPVCTAFHQTRRRVDTASATQVTRPLYRTSVGRWRAYESHIRPLIEELGDVVRSP